MTGPLAIVIAVTFLACFALDRWIVRQTRHRLAQLDASRRTAECAPGHCGGTWHVRMRYPHGNAYEFVVRDPLAAAHCYLIDGRLPEARA